MEYCVSTPSTAFSVAQRVANRLIVKHNTIHQTEFFSFRRTDHFAR